MERFFYRTDRERSRLIEIRNELSKVGALIDRYDKKRNGYNVGKQFEVDWIFFVVSDGNVADEIIMRSTFTTVEIMRRMLFKQVKTLKELEALHKDKH